MCVGIGLYHDLPKKKKYSSLRKQTAQHLTLASLGRSKLQEGPSEGGDRSKSVFAEDESLPLAFRAKLVDYVKSGYDRGHMCVFRCSFLLCTHEMTIAQGPCCRRYKLTGLFNSLSMGLDYLLEHIFML
jgi:hypothetical protein